MTVVLEERSARLFSSLENKCVTEDLFFRVNILVMDYAGGRFSSVIVKGYAWQ